MEGCCCISIKLLYIQIMINFDLLSVFRFSYTDAGVCDGLYFEILLCLRFSSLTTINRNGC